MSVLEILFNYLNLLLSLTAEMAPYLMLGFLLAGFTHAFFPKEWIKNHLGGNGFSQSFKASLFGVPLPVCSCGIIPLAKELKKNGASNGGVAAFLASTPQTGVDSIAATAGLMGWPFAILRVVVAFVSGIFTGTLIGVTEKSGNEAYVDREENGSKKSFNLLKVLKYGLFELPGEIRNSLSLGLLIAALISLILPNYSEIAANNNVWFSYAGALFLAVPLYVCSTGSIPIAIALIASGFTPGAALIFLIAGPATNIVTLITMIEIIGLKNMLLYLVSVVGVAIIAAVLVDSSLLSIDFAKEIQHLHDHGITTFQWICLIVLITSMFYEPTNRSIRRMMKKITSANRSTEWQACSLDVEGIGCKKCAAKIVGIIEKIPNHQDVVVDVEKGTVDFKAETIDISTVSKKLEVEGYKVVGSK